MCTEKKIIDLRPETYRSRKQENSEKCAQERRVHMTRCRVWIRKSTGCVVFWAPGTTLKPMGVGDAFHFLAKEMR